MSKNPAEKVRFIDDIRNFEDCVNILVRRSRSSGVA